MMQIQDWSIRRRIMASVAAAITVMCVCLIITIRLNQQTIEKAGESYKTNAELTAFSMDIAQMEKAMETYVTYRTFESIDAYYHFQSISESECSQFQSKPSTDDILQKEYIVNQITSSFFSCSKKVIAARRANDMTDVSSIYRTCLECYSMLQNEISKLNIMFMQKNAALYNTNRSSFSVLTRTSIVFISVFFLLVFAVLYLSVTSITKPLADISGIALRVANRDFDVPLFNSRSNNEIGNICRAFDRMIISIREYIDTIWEKAKKETELKEKEMEMRELYADAQFRALQNQINPHFLFNTLNTGAQLAMIEGADKTCYFMEQVSDFFRYNIQQESQAVTIDEELALVDSFVYIMKVRFGSRIEFAKNVPSGKYTQMIPRMTLQPLVENCIKHGISGKTGKVELALSQDAYFITITVSDNGCGFPADLRRRIFDSVQPDGVPVQQALNASAVGTTGTGMGLINVISRLRLYFHRSDVFDILENDGGRGTKFLIHIPNV